MRLVVCTLAALGVCAFASPAFAEDGDAGSKNPIQYTTEPLRLALTRDQFQFMGRMPGCERMADPPEDRWLTREPSPRLHFLAMVRSGCGLETGGGGGIAYSTEIRPNVFFVASIGAWLLPKVEGVRQDHRLDPVGRLDLVVRRKDGTSWNFGLFASTTTLGLGFGFTW